MEIERNQGRNAIECSVAPFEGHYTQQAYVQVVRDITDRRRLAAERETLVLALGERIKELRCIQAIAQLIETPGLTLAQLLQGVTERLAAGFGCTARRRWICSWPWSSSKYRWYALTSPSLPSSFTTSEWFHHRSH